MYRKFIKQSASNGEPAGNGLDTDHLIEEAVKRAITDAKKDDPLAGAKIGAKEITRWLTKVLENERGLHVQTLLCVAGSLAGYACQASIREEFVVTKGLPETEVFTLVGCGDGRNYYYGDKLNAPLAENKYSIWTMAAGTAQHLGVEVST